MIRGVSNMKTLVTLLLSLLLFVTTAEAQLVQGIPFAEETITVSTTSVGFTANLCGNGSGLIQVLTNSIRIRLDSATATVDSSDYLLETKNWFAVKHPSRVRMIREGGADATVKITCFVS